MDSAPRRLGPLAGQVVRPGRGSASWLYRDFSSWGPHRAPGGPFDDWQGLGSWNLCGYWLSAWVDNGSFPGISWSFLVLEKWVPYLACPIEQLLAKPDMQGGLFDTGNVDECSMKYEGVQAEVQGAAQQQLGHDIDRGLCTFTCFKSESKTRTPASEKGCNHEREIELVS